MKKVTSFLKKLVSCCPKAARPCYLIAVLALILHLLFLISPAVADFYNRYPGAFFRMLLATLTGWLPFSLAETLVMLLPLLIVLTLILIIRVAKGTLRDMAKMTLSLLAVLLSFLSSFTLTFAAGYRGTSLSEKLDLTEAPVSAEELESTAYYLLSELEPLLDELSFAKDGFSRMPYSFTEMNDHLQDAYQALAKTYDFLPSFRSTIKPIILSEPLTYTHISGIYTYFTGESNINTNFPDYTLPYTAAHELAHQRGIAREDEANFIAFLVCAESDDPYVRYSGYMSIYEYVISALYRADSKAYYALLKETDSRLVGEMAAYQKFFDKYRKNVVADISSSVNDNFLQSQGQTAGVRSYGMVVDLTVAYYKSISSD